MLPLLLAFAQADAPRTLEEVPLSLQVNHAIALGVDALKGMQSSDGTYRFHDGPHPGGTTALVAYTLLKSGVPRSDPALQRALEALEGNEFKSTYSASVHLLLCEALHDPAREREARRSLEYLLEHQEQGVWGYPWGHLCNSNTQFALLALRAAARLGLEVPEEAWIAAADGLQAFRERDGGFRYQPERGAPPYAGITAAALASWAVLEEAGRGSAKVRKALAKHADDMEDSVAWLERHFDVGRNRYGDGTWTPSWHHAYLWAIERWCGLSGRTRVADRDWYATGAAWLLDTQRADGSWAGEDRRLENTCFALLFLRRSTVSGGAELARLDAEIARLRAERGEPPIRPGGAAVRVTDWLLAGPWQQGRGEVLLEDPPFDPEDLEPRPGRKVARSEWRQVSLLPERWTDIDDLAAENEKGDRQLWVLATRLTWAPPQGDAPVDALLWLDLEDGWSVWLDGENLSRERRRGSAINGDVRVPLRLAPGEHLLLVLLEDLGGAAAFGARLTDAQNGPPPAGLSSNALGGRKR